MSNKFDNVIDAKKELRDAIVAYFKQNFFGQENFTDIVVIWISDVQPEYRSYIRNGEEDFKNDLCTELDNRRLNAVSKTTFVFKTENPPGKFTEIAEGIFIQLVENKEKIKDVFIKAKITVAEGKGSLMKTEYILDAAEQIEYNIGRGTGNNNHIIIRNNDPENSEINSYVSRRHAKIVFVDQRGFYLQSRNENNRTIINRKNQRVADLTDLNTKSLLQNNDEIELGKSVCLKFEIITEEETDTKQ